MIDWDKMKRAADEVRTWPAWKTGRDYTTPHKPEKRAMTDKTQYCPLCEAAQREIAELGRRVRALDFVVDELKAEPRASVNEIRSAYLEGVKQGLGAIDEAIAWADSCMNDPEDGIGPDADIELSFVHGKLREIRAKYAGPICPTCGDRDGPWLPEKNYICEKCERGEK